ncbi:MAG: hypothetical protein ABWY54_00460 [Glaciihabitans sp.]
MANLRRLRRRRFPAVLPSLVSSFCGWLTAVGASVVAAEVLTVLGIPLGVGRNTDSSMDAEGALLLLTIHLLAFSFGGYIAGRAAPAAGALSGLAVWGWSVLAAGAVAVITLQMGDDRNVLAALNCFPRFPVGEGPLSPATLITVVMLWISALIGAVAGGARGSFAGARVPAV